MVNVSHSLQKCSPGGKTIFSCWVVLLNPLKESFVQALFAVTIIILDALDDIARQTKKDTKITPLS